LGLFQRQHYDGGFDEVLMTNESSSIIHVTSISEVTVFNPSNALLMGIMMEYETDVAVLSSPNDEAKKLKL
jgi:hypothetical protein